MIIRRTNAFFLTAIVCFGLQVKKDNKCDEQDDLYPEHLIFEFLNKLKQFPKIDGKHSDFTWEEPRCRDLNLDRNALFEYDKT